MQASSYRALRSFISVSVAAPTLSWATPPASLASRSCSFSRSYSLSVLVDLPADHVARPSMAFLFAGAFRDRGVLGVDLDLLGPAEVIHDRRVSCFTLAYLLRGRLRKGIELHAQVLEDGLAAGQHGDVFEHGLAAIAVARGLDGTDLQDALELVDHQRRQGVAFDVLGDDEQRLLSSWRSFPAAESGS